MHGRGRFSVRWAPCFAYDDAARGRRRDGRFKPTRPKRGNFVVQPHAVADVNCRVDTAAVIPQLSGSTAAHRNSIFTRPNRCSCVQSCTFFRYYADGVAGRCKTNPFWRRSLCRNTIFFFFHQKFYTLFNFSAPSGAEQRRPNERAALSRGSASQVLSAQFTGVDTRLRPSKTEREKLKAGR